MRWHTESVWRQERIGIGVKTDKERDREVGETTAKSAREREKEGESDETAINEMWPPSVSAARLRSDILYFLMKKDKIKKIKLSASCLLK